MKISLLDHSLYLKGLVLLLRQDQKIDASERIVAIRVGKMLGFENKFTKNVIKDQEQLAQTLSVKQAAVSKLEKRTDMYISTLRNFIKAMGGDLEIIATFPDGSVQISQFENIAAKTERGNFPSSA